jgi:hypothetical protein
VIVFELIIKSLKLPISRLVLLVFYNKILV